ncbi:MAG: hypothetical protein LBU83_07680 [Bacteroidales bacterium]|jgi:hypothetical protein|nr:hypothetical protein [Bacteroidales bacterium]
MNNRDIFIELLADEDLTAEEREEMINLYDGFRAGKTIYQIMTVDKIPQWCGMHPKNLFKFISWFTFEYIMFGTYELKFRINSFFKR